MAKLNPNRQKMINMMYLVLTALLALNISKQVLRAFDLVNFSLETTNSSFDAKNKDTWEKLTKQYQLVPAKAKTAYEAGQTVIAKSDAMIKQIQTMKEYLVKTGEEYEINDKESGMKQGLGRQEDIEIGMRYFGSTTDVPGAAGNGEKLRVALENYKAEMNKLIKESAKVQEEVVSIDTKTERKVSEGGGNTKQNWTEFFFLHYPLVSNITMLSNFETQVNNAKGELLRRLLASIGQEDFKFDQLSAIISAEKPVVLEGDEYKANVVLGAYDSKANPKIVINGAPATVKDGKAEYKVRASGQGNKKIAGYIEVMKEGKPMQYKFETEYQVFKGSATISADKMNVVYIGLDNPISVSVPGFPPSALQVSCTGASLTGSAGKYVLKPVDNKDVKECVIKVSVKDGNKVSTMGQASYRIKMVPAPKVKLGTLEGGKKSKVELSVQNVLAAVLENFVFEGVKWDVTEYSYYYVSKAGGSSGFKEAKISGKVIDGALKNYISTGRAGDVISFNQIRTVGPGGAARTIQQGPTFILQ